MTAIATTIGTDSRNYCTITAWEADDGGGDGLGADDCTGTMYNDSVFDETPTIDFSANSIVLTALVADQHDGTAGSGVRNELGSGGIGLLVGSTIGVPVTIEWIEFKGGGAVNANIYGIIANSVDESVTIRNCIVWSFAILNQAFRTLRGIQLTVDSSFTAICTRNIVYDIVHDDTGVGIGIDMNATGTTYCSNNTVHGITDASSVGTGISGDIDFVQNNVVAACPGACYAGTPGTTESHNLATDDTDAGTGSIGADDGVLVAALFVSATNDFHIQDTAADQFEAGTDLVVTPLGINIDIDGYDADVGGTTWSMGAHDGNNLRGAATNMLNRYASMAGGVGKNIFSEGMTGGMRN